MFINEPKKDEVENEREDSEVKDIIPNTPAEEKPREEDTETKDLISELRKQNEQFKIELEKTKKEFKEALKQIGETQRTLQEKEEKKESANAPYLKKFKI